VLAIDRVVTRFDTAAEMFATIEMQISGEPLAQAMGRDLRGYDRNALRPDQYADPAQGGRVVTDVPGYATAVESYEYSRQPMNNVAFESGAGVALAFGPVVNPRGRGGRAAHDLLRDRVQAFAIATHAGVRAADGPDASLFHTGFVAVPAPEDNPLNTLGFGGLWPTMHPFRAFDPTIRPSNNATRGCTLTGGYGASAGAAQPVGDYECGYASLHLPARRDQSERLITAGASGFAAWKYALWIINYVQLFHDSEGHAIARVAPEDLARVGVEGNTVRGVREDGSPGAPGTWLGASDIEGFQGAVMTQALEDQAQHLLTALTTTDGVTLSGFASLADALAYDYAAPLRWVPGAVEVTETPDLQATFPRPTGYTLREAHAPLLDALSLVGGYAELFALTDHRNPDVGGSATARAWFDGAPFADDDQIPDGDATPHDRWLAALKFALVSLDRLYARPDDLLASRALPAGGGEDLATEDAAYAVVTLRTARRALAGRLTLYSDATPDGVVTRTALDGTSWRGSPRGASVADRLTTLLQAHARLLHDRLTTPEGEAFAGFSYTRQAPTGPGGLEAHAAAVRGLLEAFLATGEVRYRARAVRVFERIEARFRDARADMYRFTADPRADGATTWTPRRFALVQSALRELYKLVGARSGQEALGTLLTTRLGRLQKLVLNGWDDRDHDEVVDWPGECLRVEGGLPRGGLQMAERALTGELGIEGGVLTADRDHDCVPEIDDVLLPAALAAEVRIVVREPGTEEGGRGPSR
jgi:hypothetical protein